MTGNFLDRSSTAKMIVMCDSAPKESHRQISHILYDNLNRNKSLIHSIP